MEKLSHLYLALYMVRTIWEFVQSWDCKTSQKPSSITQYTALLFQIAICCLWRQTLLIKAVFHPASYTVDCSLSGILAKLKFVNCKSRNLEIVHVCYTISRLECNLRILRMCNAISRLRKFSDCTEHILKWSLIEHGPTMLVVHSQFTSTLHHSCTCMY